MGSQPSCELRQKINLVSKYPFRENERNTKIAQECGPISALNIHDVVIMMSKHLEQIRRYSPVQIATSIYTNGGNGLIDYTTRGIFNGLDATSFIEFLVSIRYIKTYQEKLSELVNSVEFQLSSEDSVSYEDIVVPKREILAIHSYLSYLTSIFTEVMREMSPVPLN